MMRGTWLGKSSPKKCNVSQSVSYFISRSRPALTPPPARSPPSPKADVHSGTARQRNSWGSSPSIEQRLWTARCSSSRGFQRARACVLSDCLCLLETGHLERWVCRNAEKKAEKQTLFRPASCGREVRSGPSPLRKKELILSSLHNSPSRSCRAATAEARRKSTHVTAPTPACIGNST